MEKDNTKSIIAFVLFAMLLVGVYFWGKYKKAKELAASNTGAKPATGTAGATIAANTVAGKVKDNYYPYGSGKIYFEERDPSTYKTTELLSFTPDLSVKSAFKSLN